MIAPPDQVITRLRASIMRLAWFAFLAGVWSGVVGMALWVAGKCAP